jgi:hypothetical protein
MHDMQSVGDVSDLPVFKRLPLNRIGGLRMICERLPDAPAVYAFVRQIPLPPTHDAEAFVSSLEKTICLKAAPDHSASFGPLHKGRLQSFSELSEQKALDLKELSQNEEFRKIVRSVIEHAVPLQAPLYVGKALSLRTRFSQHIKPMSPLNVRLRAAGTALEDCSLLYTELDSLPAELDPNVLNLIEEILTRLLRPGFVLRIG